MSTQGSNFMSVGRLLGMESCGQSLFYLDLFDIKNKI
jgi:hypothetical protein